MQREEIRCGVQLLNATHLLDTVVLEQSAIGHKRVVCNNTHTQSLSLASHQSAHIAVGVDTNSLALQFEACAGRKAVARHIYHHSQSQLRHSVRVLTRGIHHHDATCRSSRQIDIVEASASTHNDFQLLGSLDNLGRNLVATNDEAIDILYSLQQSLLLGVTLQKSHLVVGRREYILDSIQRLLREGFFGCNKYLHRFYLFSIINKISTIPLRHITQKWIARRQMIGKSHSVCI